MYIEIFRRKFECYLIESWLKLKAVPEEIGSREDVQPEAGPRRGHDQPAQVPHVPHGLGPHQRDESDVVLLTLVLVYGGHLYKYGTVSFAHALHGIIAMTLA